MRSRCVFDVHRDLRVVGDAAPAFDERNTVFQPIGPYVGLQIDVVGAELAHVLDDRLEIVHDLRITLRLPRHVVCTQEVGDLFSILVVEEAHARAVETGVADHLQLLLERPFEAVGAALLHGPQRLIDEQALHAAIGARAC